MKLIDNILYLEFTELVDCGVNEEAIKKAKLRKSASWLFLNDPEDNRRVLIGYEKLGTSYKDKVNARFGNPYHFVACQPIKNMVKWDEQAQQFFLDYRYDENKCLPKEHVDKYTKAASWLNMLKAVNDDKKTLKTLLKLSIVDFYTNVKELIKIENVDLPTDYRKLMAKRKKYETFSYAALISGKFGNNQAAKVKDELALSVLLEMIKHENQYDDVFVCQQYNNWASEFGYASIVPATVGIHRRKNNPDIIMFREGNAALNEKYLPVVKGFRPTFPLAMVESDDNHLDLQFIDLETNNPYARYKVIIVMDAYNDMLLGYAYSDKPVLSELVRAAYINAMYYIRSLTGAWHMSHETKADNYAIKELRPFYESMGNFIKTPVGSKHRGYIEQMFSKPHWKRCLKLGANNYTGNNVTALTTGVNREAVQRNIKNRPILGKESIEQVEQFFHRLRHMPQTGSGKSKQEEWLEAWNSMEDSQKKPITDEQFLLTFGIEHNHLGEGIRITNKGVNPKINNVQYSYDLKEFDTSHIGKSVSIFYDPYDMSRVLVTDHDKIRMMAYEPRLQSRALADGSVDSRHFLNLKLAMKTDIVKNIGDKADKRQKVLANYFVDPESVLASGVMVKELKQEAEQLFLGDHTNNNNDIPFNPFDQI